MDDSKALVLRYVEAVWNQANVAALDELTLADFRYYLGGQPGLDRAGMRQFLAAMRVAFPDWQVAAVDVVAEADAVAVRWQGMATHRGPFRGIPATGRRIVVSGINLYRIQAGRIAAEWEQMDSLGMLRQLGALPG